MNDHSLRVLEYDTFLALLSGYARSEPGQARVRALRPRRRPEDVAADRALFADAAALRRQGVELPAAAFVAVDDALARAAPDRAVLDPEGFADVRQLLRCTREVRLSAGGPRCAAAPAVQALAGELDPCDALAGALERTFDDEQGHVRDGASDALRRLRTRIAAIEHTIQGRLEALLRAAAGDDVFQEDFVTQRHGRFVVPVRREARGRVRGIVHDQSNSGGTLFVEPEGVVESGNELECLRLDERDEVRRLLAALTDCLREHIPALHRNVELLCRYDVAGAVGAWACAGEALPAAADGPLRLIGARHPLLHHRLAAEGRLADLVPLDFAAPPDRRVVVITGSNTGGKTVALKTIGLLSLLAQTGLPVPAAAGTQIPFFDDVLADIGDEQSIQQNLSTFSAHVEHVAATLRAAAGASCLVLLDELGAGTDPEEGGALGCAILDALSAAGGLTVATTHLGAVKQFVHGHPAMANATMQFDIETLRPEYRLLMGRAGASYAMTIAARHGMPPEVIAAARGLVSAGARDLESMLADLDRQRKRLDGEIRELERTRDEARAARDVAARDRDEIGRKLRELRKERRELLRAAQDEAAALVAGARREVDEILARARGATAGAEARELRRRLDQRSQALAADRAAPPEPPEQPLAGPPRAGDRVWVESIKGHGIVTAVGDGGRRVTVEIGGLRFEVKGDDLGRPRAPEAASGRPPGAVRHPSRARDVPSELNLVGTRVADALDALARYIDAAALAGLREVRIVHGYGTGALGRAVHEWLDAAGLAYRLGVDGRDAGGSGVTHVALAGA